MTITILRDGIRERLGGARLAPCRMPIEAEIAALEHRLAVLTSRPEIRRDPVHRAALLLALAGALEDIKAAMLASATDLSPGEIAEACRVALPPLAGPHAGASNAAARVEA